MASYATSMVGWVALAAGAVGMAALVFIILFYTVGGVFGPLNDVCNGLLGILSGVLAALLYAQTRADAPLLSLVGLVVALAGAVVVLVVSGRTGWYRAAVYTIGIIRGWATWSPTLASGIGVN
jgi:hypothetical protein